MDKKECILKYYLANRSYLSFLYSIFQIEEEYSENILDRGNVSGAKLGCISNILLSIKEELILNKGNLNYESNLLEYYLQSLIENIALKTPDGYKIGSYVFKNAIDVVRTLRNSIAHGSFIPDLNHNKIILLVDNENIKINIDVLANFMVLALSCYFNRKKLNEYTKEAMVSEVFCKSRKELITDVKEFKNILKSVHNIEFTLKRIDGKNIEHSVMVEFEKALEEFVSDNKLLHVKEFEKKVYPNYELITKDNYMKNELDIEKMASYLKQRCPRSTYKNQIFYICHVELRRYFNKKDNKNLPLVANYLNLVMLTAIKENKTKNMNVLSKFINDKHIQGVYYNYDHLAITTISMFNSLFSYALDDVYNDSSEFANLRNDGLDFSLLDLSLLETSLVTINEKPLKNSIIRYDSLNNKLNKLNEIYSKYLNNLEKVDKNKEKAIHSLQQKLDALKEDKEKIKKELSSVSKYLSDLKAYYLDNKKHIENKAKITGLRNAIAHGNYEIIFAYDDFKLIFTDFDGERMTFKVEISLYDFADLIDANKNVIEDFINKKVKTI